MPPYFGGFKQFAIYFQDDGGGNEANTSSLSNFLTFLVRHRLQLKHNCLHSAGVITLHQAAGVIPARVDQNVLLLTRLCHFHLPVRTSMCQGFLRLGVWRQPSPISLRARGVNHASPSSPNVLTLQSNLM